MNKYGLGAIESKKDERTVKHGELTLAGSPLLNGGVDYFPLDIENQHKAGICTAISLTQNRQKATGKRYSAEFQYLLQKKFYDKNWTEGSSIFYALKVGLKYGFLPAEHWTHTTEADRELPYYEYIKKLQISDIEIQRLLTLCIDKIAGYAQVDVKDPQALAKAIDQSSSGILCRYNCGSTWWVPPVDPLRKPEVVVSGHAVTMSKFNYLQGFKQTIINTWGMWCNQGKADTYWGAYSPTEAWIVLDYTVLRKQLPSFSDKVINTILDLLYKFYNRK